LTENQFKVISRTNEIIKLKVGMMNLEFFNREKSEIQEVRGMVEGLTRKLDEQTAKNRKLETMVEEQEGKMRSMEVRMQEMRDATVGTVEHLKRELDDREEVRSQAHALEMT